jgi:hypothetical protein
MNSHQVPVKCILQHLIKKQVQIQKYSLTQVIGQHAAFNRHYPLFNSTAAKDACQASINTAVSMYVLVCCLLSLRQQPVYVGQQTPAHARAN